MRPNETLDCLGSFAGRIVPATMTAVIRAEPRIAGKAKFAEPVAECRSTQEADTALLGPFPYRCRSGGSR